MTLRALAPTGWRVTATCHFCGHVSACYGDGEFLLCRSCFNDEHGFDPRACEWDKPA